MHLYETIWQVETAMLQNGDLVRTHGCVFRLRDRAHLSGHVVAFRTDLVATMPDASIPPHWRHGWIIQGNHRAIWDVVRQALPAAQHTPATVSPHG